MLRRVPRATWILLVGAAVLGVVGLSMASMLVRDVLLLASIAVLVAAFLPFLRTSRQRRHPDPPPSDGA